jgi:hypothetical protein
MTEHLVVLRAHVSQKHLSQKPSKPPIAPFVGFEGDQCSRFSARMGRMAGGGVCMWELASK